MVEPKGGRRNWRTLYVWFMGIGGVGRSLERRLGVVLGAGWPGMAAGEKERRE